MSSRENKQLIRKLYAEGYPEGPEAIRPYFSKSYVDHNFGDLSGLQATLSAFHQAFPNANWKVQSIIASGDKVAVHASIEIFTATGLRRTVGAMAFYRIEGGKIVEQWGYGDPLF